MVKQLNLFLQQSFNTTRELKECMATVVSESGLSREAFLEQMNELADRFGVRLMKGNSRSLTMATFEKWLNPNNKDHIPNPNALSVFCEVGKSTNPLQVLANPLGAQIISEKDVKLLLWAKEYHMVREAKKKMRKLEAEI